MTKQKILILNSVGKDENNNFFIHFPSRWTALVKEHKAFTFYPYELAYLSTLLKRETEHEVKMYDGNLLNLNWQEYFDLIKDDKPDFAIFETSTAVYNEDLKLAKKLKQTFGTKIIFTGQHPTAMPEQTLQDGIDFVCIGEFEDTLLDFFTNGLNPNIAGIFPHGYRPPLNINKLPFPEDEDIKRNQYYDIGGCDFKEIEFFASRGCPMKCNYCVCGNLYYDPKTPNYRVREVKSIIDEIKQLKEKYPEMEGIFYDEEYHNVNKQFIMDLCQAKIDNGLDKLKYNAMCGYWTMDEEMLRKMKQAGYYKLRIGIETVSEESLKAIRKNINVTNLKTILKLAKEIGIQMYGTFTFGSLGSNDTEDKKTIEFIKECLKEDLLADYQISLCTPQPGTPFYDYLKQNNLFLTNDFSKFDGGTAVYSYPNYSKEQIEANCQKATQIYIRSQVLSPSIFKIIKRNIEKHGLGHTIKYGFITLKNIIK
ncbi:hypothetical protein A2533_04385 [Candidatus Falkowbacteria bacterium RIFOXYD2_FULL_35_9]|uniref:Uncharacterized protein n=1 Tax=Candidatus Falkowbacteria bacterium RIFOXYC2_FULL_36_12 TaxID=1798002 RepID=A0A1F5T0W9_9BACT|nr:MAG: hypothetical protein A2300_02685 [Candidatus Falkowbacteria bacterium RIFOXYB2_FULL_35_7]OGF32393.1 MAG: hypothetical protein A2478_03680 [Candidatus Falkowbacteria bacterium RIFOXYC2_FULL_36_12]OGF48357.1 MAG: hypothetical protein A2533_04385 [Candidatus Falkowbacteria bacterium RIFOXYD2_FULL_35_9]